MYRWKMFTIKKTIDIAAHAQVHNALQHLGTSSAETGIYKILYVLQYFDTVVEKN